MVWVVAGFGMRICGLPPETGGPSNHRAGATGDVGSLGIGSRGRVKDLCWRGVNC
jgi:hypothetical protein